jgi:2-keto-4-pentenoate hydratase/2-oxohepta-3-ene-1,7-dioic acid hydratase in catechol pathway
MAQRYVRVKTSIGTIHYGLLAPNHEVQILDVPPWLGGNLTGQVLADQDYQLLPPCLPSKIVAVGKNYADHAAEMGTPVPLEPLLFLKPPTTVIPPEQAILYPYQSQQVEFEGELALVIGEPCRHCDPETAQTKIWGYTIASFCPLGPWIVRELSPSAQLQTFLNDEPTPRQSACIDQMTFPPDQLVSYISQVMTLLPGDVILTGTPAGVAPLQAGDKVRIEIEGIGTLANPVAAWQA